MERKKRKLNFKRQKHGRRFTNGKKEIELLYTQD